MATAARNSCTRPTLVADHRAEPERIEATDLLALARRPWTMRVRENPLLVRTSSARDIAGVAQMHHRCSPRSLLDRYRAGGRPPAVAALDWALRNPLSFVVIRPEGHVVATASIARDPDHGYTCARAELLVEDAWQRLGIGGELMSHVAGVAHAAGFTELVAYPATAVLPAQRLMIEIGRTRMVPDASPHLHTYLPESAALGLGAVRQRLAG